MPCYAIFDRVITEFYCTQLFTGLSRINIQERVIKTAITGTTTLVYPTDLFVELKVIWRLGAILSGLLNKQSINEFSKDPFSQTIDELATGVMRKLLGL